MTLKQLLIAVLTVAQLKGCATFVCTAVDRDPYPSRSTRLQITGGQKLIDVRELSDAVMLFVTGDDESAAENNRTLLLWNERSGTQPLTAFRGRFAIGERLFTQGNHWLYTLAGVFDNKWGVIFLEGEGANAAAPAFVELPLSGAGLWLPLETTPPRGLYLSQGAQQSFVLDVTPAGIQHRWTLDRRLEVHPGWWSAEALPDGRLALVGMEGAAANAPSRLVLRLLDGSEAADKPPAEIVLQEARQYGRIASAVNQSGLLAIAAYTSKGIEAGVIDPRAHDGIRFFDIGDQGDTEPYPRVSATGRDFTVTWNEVHHSKLELRARSLTATSTELLATTVASEPQRGDSRVPFMAVNSGEETLFAWHTGDVTLRRLPRPLAGYQFFNHIRDLLCRDRRPAA